MANFKTKLPTVEEMLEAGVHFGHQVKRKNPNMDKYVYAVDDKTHIIDLYKTQEFLEKACNALFEIASRGEEVVFVGTKRQASHIIEKYAKESGSMYVTQRWLGGTLTNYDSVKSKWVELARLEEGVKTGAFNKYTKKERLLIDRKIEKLESYVGGIRNLSSKPGAVIVVDVKREKTAVREARATRVPVFGLVDTNSDPKGIDYLIPMNDDAMKSIELVISVLANIVKEGYAASVIAKEKLANKSSVKIEEKPIDTKDIEVAIQAETEVKSTKKAKPVVAKAAPKKAQPKKSKK